MGRKDPNLELSRPPPLPPVAHAPVGQTLGWELICAATVSMVSTTRGPLCGQNKKGKLGGNLHPPPPGEWEGRLGDKGRRDCWQHSEGSGGDDGEPRESVARPAHCDKELHMNGHHFV